MTDAPCNEITVRSVLRIPSKEPFHSVAVAPSKKEESLATMHCMPRATVFGVQTNSEEPKSEATAKEQI